LIKEGETVYLTDNKTSFFIKVKKGEKFGTHKGTINHDEIINKNYGDYIETHKGHKFQILKPTLYDFIMYGIKRKTQIIYPKDSAYITLKLGLRSGMKVLESGIGSGALTIVMANAVYPEGMIYAYEKEEKHIEVAKQNLQLVGFLNSVKISHKDLSEIDETDFDAGFIDVREPWHHIPKIKKVLKKGAPIGFLVPTVNQIINLLESLKENNFIQIETMEILLRKYKPVPDRFRPEDRMVAHTGYLIFAKNG
jgi:tRNA (adenine57-N1/adenine58-N1)-methyltransferase